MWDEFLLQRPRCKPEEGGYIRATLLNIVGYWKSWEMLGRMTNEAMAMLLFPTKDPKNTNQVERGLTNNDKLTRQAPLLDYALSIVRGRKRQRPATEHATIPPQVKTRCIEAPLFAYDIQQVIRKD